METIVLRLKTFFSKNGPELSPQLKHKLAKLMPTFTLAAAVLGVLALRPILGLGVGGSILSALTGSFGLAIKIGISTLAIAIATILYVKAYPKVKQYNKIGWDLMLKAQLLMLAESVFNFTVNGFNGFGALMFTVLIYAGVIYAMFQVREYFTGEASVTSSEITNKEDID